MPTARAQMVSEAVRLQLPSSYLHVTHLLQPTSSELLALAAAAPPEHHGASPAAAAASTASSSPRGASPTPPAAAVYEPPGAIGAHAWVAWHLVPSAAPLPNHHHALAAPAGAFILTVHQLLAQGPEPPPPPHADVVITCADVPAAGGGACATGTSNGAVQLWDLGRGGYASSSAAAGAAGRPALGAVAPKLVHVCWCEVPLLGPGPAQGDAGEVSGVIPRTSASDSPPLAAPPSLCRAATATFSESTC